MSALIDLPAEAIAGDWLVDTSEPDHFGDVRTKAISDAATITMVFDKTGKLTGAYMSDRRRRNYHTTRVSDVKNWLRAVDHG